MKLQKIDHIGIVAKDLTQAAAEYQDHFGFEAGEIKDIPAMGIQNLVMNVGETFLEFLRPTVETGPLAKFVEERGEGTYHLSLAVDDLPAAIEELKAKGIRASEPVGGISWVSTRAAHGVILQLIQR